MKSGSAGLVKDGKADDKAHAMTSPNCLVADVGGTNARFGWLAQGCSHVSEVATLACADHDGLEAAAQAYLSQLAQRLGPGYAPPGAAAFAVATAVSSETVTLTNNGWTFSRASIADRLGLEQVILLNDFEALALALPHLRPSQLRTIGPTLQPAGQAAMAVIGPGTGLGVAGIVPSAEGWVAVPGEGGHSSLAAGGPFEAELLAAVWREHSHVSAERLLSGIGLPVLHRAVAAVLGRSSPELSAEQIVELGLARQDEVCDRSLDAFCALLGSFAGNVALTLGARGGVFIGGGIVPRLGERFFESRFRERFEAKGRFEDYLRAIPTALVTDTLVALTGAAVALASRRL